MRHKGMVDDFTPRLPTVSLDAPKQSFFHTSPAGFLGEHRNSTLIGGNMI